MRASANAAGHRHITGGNDYSDDSGDTRNSDNTRDDTGSGKFNRNDHDAAMRASNSKFEAG